MPWFDTIEHKLTLGRLITTYREHERLNQDLVADHSRTFARMTANDPVASSFLETSVPSGWSWSPSLVSRMENDNTLKRPPKFILFNLARALGCTHREYTALLLAADLAPTPDEVKHACILLTSQLEAYPFPCLLVDYQARVHAWNAAFTTLVGGRNPQRPPSSSDSGLPATGGGVTSDRQALHAVFPGLVELLGPGGLDLFTLAVSPDSPLYRAIQPGYMLPLQRHIVRHFWLLVRRLDQQGWNHELERRLPEWFLALQQRVRSLPMTGEQFGLVLAEVEQEMTKGVPMNDQPQVLSQQWELDTIDVPMLGGRNYRLQWQNVSDARFAVLMFLPATL